MQTESDRLLLRPMTLDDSQELLEIFSDPRVMASFGGLLFDRPRMELWVERNLKHQEQHGYGLFSVILKSEGRLIGNCGLEHMEIDGAGEVELGYDFRSDCWGNGYATEAAIAVRELAFAEIGLPRLISLIRSTNLASLRVSEKVGMAKQRELIRGEEMYWIYAVSKDET